MFVRAFLSGNGGCCLSLATLWRQVRAVALSLFIPHHVCARVFECVHVCVCACVCFVCVLRSLLWYPVALFFPLIFVLLLGMSVAVFARAAAAVSSLAAAFDAFGLDGFDDALLKQKRKVTPQPQPQPPQPQPQPPPQQSQPQQQPQQTQPPMGQCQLNFTTR